jgi:DNA-binding GntR family transcriptional regulator
LTTAFNEAIIRKSANAVALATWDRLLLLVARLFTSNVQSKR